MQFKTGVSYENGIDSQDYFPCSFAFSHLIAFFFCIQGPLCKKFFEVGRQMYLKVVSLNKIMFHQKCFYRRIKLDEVMGNGI